MELITLFKQLKKDEQGFTLLLVSVAMVVILGMTALVTDFGLLALHKTRLAHACDAAALAGASQLPNATGAIDTATEFAAQNGINTNLNITVTDGDKVEVSATRKVQFTFAQILGITSGTVGARSAAQYGGIKSMTGVAPLAVPDKPFEFGKEYLLKEGPFDPKTLGPGTFGTLSLGGTGSARYRDNLKYGYQGRLEIDDEVITETGNMSGSTKTGVQYRLEQCTNGCTPTNHRPDCPKILYIPVYKPPEDTLQQVKKIKIVGFAAFMLSNLPNNGNASQIQGYFLRTIPPDKMKPEINLSQSIAYGLAGTKLIK